jgi:hypothetical protein
MDILERYPEVLFELVILHYNSVLRHKLKILKDINLYYYYETHKSEVNPVVIKILNEEILNEEILNKEEKNDKLLAILKQTACEVKTNLDLVTKNYKKYGFKMTQNYGVQADMKGSVESILYECLYGKMVNKGREYNERKSALNIPSFSDDEWRFRPRRKLSKRPKKSSFKSSHKRRKSKKRSPKPRRH